jgi:putative phosphoribosyl transferase
MMFKDRRQAGRQLAAQLLRYTGVDTVVLALPRGGVPVGYEVARALHAALDITVVRKVGAPGQPEFGIGAVVDGDYPEEVLDEESVRLLSVSREYLDKQIGIALREIRRRQEVYRHGRAPMALKGRTVIVVDDGIATGGSMRVALRAARRAGPKRLVLAVPVAPPETIESLRAEVDDVVCLSTPEMFQAVGQFYEDFRQTTDDEVIRLLDVMQVGSESQVA